MFFQSGSHCCDCQQRLAQDAHKKRFAPFSGFSFCFSVLVVYPSSIIVAAAPADVSNVADVTAVADVAADAADVAIVTESISD